MSVHVDAGMASCSSASGFPSSQIETPSISEANGRTTNRIQRLPTSVVNKIAAGEIIQRPANVVKELLENSIDAGATQINIVAKDGGCKMLSIQDNGHGIDVTDLDLLCVRFATSKIRAYDDLQSIASFGFRGEALASVSHVAYLTVTSKTETSPCAYRQKYKEGLPVDKPQPCAGVRGTTMLVEDLFHSVNVVTNYAIHYPTVGFSLRKHQSTEVDICTRPGSTVEANIGRFYGEKLGKDLISVDIADSQLGIAADSQMLVSAPHVSVNSYTFVLFINHRLVQCAVLKRALQTILSAHMPIINKPFVYVSLLLPPHQIDVNVHPTKNEVHFLHQTEIMEHIQSSVDSRMRECNQSRSIVSQQIVVRSPNFRQTVLTSRTENTANASMNSSVLEKSTYDPSRLVRTDASQTKLDSFVSPSSSSSMKRSSKQDAFTQHWKHAKPSQRVDGSTNGSIGPIPSFDSETRPSMEHDDDDLQTLVGVLADELNSQREEQMCTSFPRRQLNLDSVNLLRERVCKRASVDLRNVLRKVVYIGCASADVALMQCNTSVMAMQLRPVTAEMFYQMTLFQFGNLPCIRLNPPMPLHRLLEMAPILNSNEQPISVEQSVASITDSETMLWDYFSIKIQLSAADRTAYLMAVPTVLTDYPLIAGRLPKFVADLTRILTSPGEEDVCFQDIITAIGELYAFDADYTRDPSIADWQSLVTSIMMPAIQRKLLPPHEFEQTVMAKQILDLHQLYRVFERC